MTVQESQGIAATLRRDFRIARVARIALLAVLFVCAAGVVIATEAGGRERGYWAGLALAGSAWVLLSALSIAHVRAANRASLYIASGRLDLAEEQLKASLKIFSLYGTGNLMACHNLAVIAHGQRNFQAAAELCMAVVGLAGGISKGVGRVCRILLADCRLNLGDAPSASQAIAPLCTGAAVLSLSEQLMLLPIELRCQMARGEYGPLLANLPWKLQRAELLESPRAALVHAILAKACALMGRPDDATYLRRRAGLYHDMGELAKEYRDLQDLPVGPRTADNSAT